MTELWGDGGAVTLPRVLRDFPINLEAGDTKHVKAMTFGSDALLRALVQFYKERERCG